MSIPQSSLPLEVSDQKIQYLDLTIYRNGHTCYIQPFFKETNTFSYVQGQSYHPQSIFKGILVGENTRILRNCTRIEDYEKTMKFIQEKFTTRQFPSNILQLPHIPFEQREDILNRSRSCKGTTDKSITFSCKFNKHIPIHGLLEEHWGLFSKNKITRSKLLPKEIRISYKHGRNLAQKLVRAKLIGSTKTDIDKYSIPNIRIPTFPAKNIPCRQLSCGMCDQLTSKNTYYSFQTKQCYEIKQIFSCDTKGSIYLLDCRTCAIQYIGESGTTIRARMKHHRNAYNSNVNRPIYRHAKDHGKKFDCFSITIIDQVLNIHERKQKEKYYINLLKTKLPFGLNVIK